jgi:transcriptional regulator with XRE-family HTH domain
MSLEEIRQALQDRRLSMVADATGLHYNTVRAISAGENNNPTHETMRLLSEYLQGRQHG